MYSWICVYCVCLYERRLLYWFAFFLKENHLRRGLFFLSLYLSFYVMYIFTKQVSRILHSFLAMIRRSDQSVKLLILIDVIYVHTSSNGLIARIVLVRLMNKFIYTSPLTDILLSPKDVYPYTPK
jgi:hypothetical protein